MLKSPMIWNLDWNLYSLPEIHLKLVLKVFKYFYVVVLKIINILNRCNRQFLTIFAQGIDQDTDFENSSSLVSCLSPL